jgi:hypothetical protein
MFGLNTEDILSPAKPPTTQRRLNTMEFVFYQLYFIQNDLGYLLACISCMKWTYVRGNIHIHYHVNYWTHFVKFCVESQMVVKSKKKVNFPVNKSWRLRGGWNAGLLSLLSYLAQLDSRVCQLYVPAALYPQGNSLVLTSIRAWVDHWTQGMVHLKFSKHHRIWHHIIHTVISRNHHGICNPFTNSDVSLSLCYLKPRNALEIAWSVTIFRQPENSLLKYNSYYYKFSYIYIRIY